MPTRLVVLLLGLVASPGWAQVAVADVAGCYSLDHQPWPEADSLDHLPRPLSMPAGLRLTADSLDFPHGYDDSRAVEEVGPGTADFRSWSITEEGEVYVGRPLSPGGLALFLRPEGPDLTGRLRSSTDFVREGRPTAHSVQARLTRRPCPPE